MAPKKCDFGQLKLGAEFQYHGQTYRKEAENSAVMLRWVTGEEVVGERVTHRFFAEIVVDVEVSEPDDGSVD